jgi:RNA polymerase sigma factor (TIGR02999 family)
VILAEHIRPGDHAWRKAPRAQARLHCASGIRAVELRVTEHSASEMLSETIAGDTEARNRLFAVLYDDLHARAHRELGRYSGATLSTTVLVHEAYLKLFDKPLDVRSREHFYHLAARTMRQVLIDHVRSRGRDKRGGRATAVTLGEDVIESNDLPVELVALDGALGELQTFDARLAKLAELHLFAGMEFTDIAEMLDTSERSIYREWRMARVFLRQRMGARE